MHLLELGVWDALFLLVGLFLLVDGVLYFVKTDRTAEIRPSTYLFAAGYALFAGVETVTFLVLDIPIESTQMAIFVLAYGGLIGMAGEIYAGRYRSSPDDDEDSEADAGDDDAPSTHPPHAGPEPSDD